MTHHSSRELAIQTARHWLDCDPLFLDTETTGIDSDAQICDLAIVDASGDVLFDRLIKPTIPIPDAASSIHHITNDMVASAMPLSAYWDTIRRLLSGRLIITYNANYDLRMLYQEAVAIRCHIPSIPFLEIGCAMQLYSRFYGELSRFGTYRWHKLALAAERCGIVLGNDLLHRALADAQLARQVIIYIAKSSLEAERKMELEPF